MPLRIPLLGFAVNDMLAHQRIVLLQLEAGRIVATVLERHIHMAALGAAKLNQDAVTLAFLRHLDTYYMFGLTVKSL